MSEHYSSYKPICMMANFSQEMLNLNDSLQPTHVSKMKLIAPSIFIPVAVLGLILNVGTILTVLKSRHLSTKGVHVLLVNKAVADLITSLTYPTVYAALPFGQEAELELLIISTFGSLGIYLSLLWNAAISVERFVVVYLTLKSLAYTKKMKITLTARSEEHTSELQSHSDLVCRLLLEKKKKQNTNNKNRVCKNY